MKRYVKFFNVEVGLEYYPTKLLEKYINDFVNGNNVKIISVVTEDGIADCKLRFAKAVVLYESDTNT